MSLFDKIFGRTPKPKGKYEGQYRLLNGYAPHFSSFGGSIYESELVRASIDAIATHCSKLEVTVQGAAKPMLQTRLRRAPNEFQTWSQFMYRLTTILYVHNTAIIVPVFDEYGDLSGIYPVLPVNCEMVKYNNVPYLRYKFYWGETASIELSLCGIMNRFQYKDDFFGESNQALLPTMDLIHMQNQGIKEGVKSAASYKFYGQLANFSTDEDLEKERKRFSERNFGRDADASGMLLFPNNYTNVKQIESKPFVVDAEQMAVINKAVYEYFGVNEDILQNKAFGDAWSAFYEGKIEPFAIQFSEVLTRMLFTPREIAQGSLIMATANRLQYMSNGDKLNVSAQMADRGLMTRNEIRQIWNLPPLPEPYGSQLPARGEYYNVNETEPAEEPQETEE